MAFGLWVVRRLHEKYAPPEMNFHDFTTSFANVSTPAQLHDDADLRRPVVHPVMMEQFRAANREKTMREASAFLAKCLKGKQPYPISILNNLCMHRGRGEVIETVHAPVPAAEAGDARVTNTGAVDASQHWQGRRVHPIVVKTALVFYFYSFILFSSPPSSVSSLSPPPKCRPV